MPRARAISTSMRERLEAARAEVVDREHQLVIARERRDELVVEAIDVEGFSQRVVAEAAGITGPRVAAILARPTDDEDDER